MKKLIAIYRTVFLVPSEAFIPSQLSAYKHYDRVIWCRDTVKNTSLNGFENLKCINLGEGVLWKRILFTLFGLATVDEMPSLIHAHFGPDAAMILSFAKRRKLPLVVTFHGFDVQQSRWVQFKSGRVSNLLFLLREKELYRYASKVIAVSEYLKSRLIARGCPPDKISVEYIGVDISKFNVSSRDVVKNRLINVSRHVGWKGIDTIIRALSVLVVKHPELQLIQIGEGPETSRLMHLANELGISKHIEWRGAAPHDAVVKELSSAALYVHASRMDSSGQTEAFGIALIEAQACGLPVIATRSGGIAEALSERETGFLYDEDDYVSLADKIDQLLSSPVELELKCKKAREFVVNNFNILSCTAKLEETYDDLLR
ncbi:glycosyltransferase [Methylomonas sp. TEB]|uniref:glycosyltransferase n=1 Tax=Methylomonas sp. TEB TaxID=3398229 RepID=UPI0039F613FA